MQVILGLKGAGIKQETFYGAEENGQGAGRALVGTNK